MWLRSQWWPLQDFESMIVMLLGASLVAFGP
jgi:hypothetical protein